MQVQVAAIRKMVSVRVEKGGEPVTFWRDATLVDALTIQLSAGNNAGEYTHQSLRVSNNGYTS